MKETREKRAGNAAKYREIEMYLDSLSEIPEKKGALMGALHKVQETFGYIPRDAMEFLSEKLAVPQSHIYGMATFYNFFSLKPKARNQIYVCKGTACYVAGGDRILRKLKEILHLEEGDSTPDGKFSLHVTRCLGCCGLSPVVKINDDVYVRMVPERIPSILKKYSKKR